MKHLTVLFVVADSCLHLHHERRQGEERGGEVHWPLLDLLSTALKAKESTAFQTGCQYNKGRRGDVVASTPK